MRLTRSGAAIAISVPIIAVIGWLFGQPELMIVAGVGAAVLILAAVRLRLIPVRVEVHRSARPARMHMNEPCQIVLRVRNVSRTRSPVLRLSDDVGRFGQASLQLAPLPSGATRDASYVFPTNIRGLHHVGPLVVEVEDGFAMWRSRFPSPSVDAVIVLPRVHRLSPIPPAPGDEPEQGRRALTSNSTLDEEFAALRPYIPGDDIRRIHWRTTARQGAPVVRQFDEPWQHRTTVLLDVRRMSHDDESLERAISAAASLLELAAQRNELVRMVTTSGLDSGFVNAADRVDSLMDQLAELHADSRGSLNATVAAVSRQASGRLVTCIGSLEAAETRGLVRASRRFGLHVVVASGGVPPGEVPGGPIVVANTTDDGLTEAWARVIGSLSDRGGRNDATILSGLHR